MSESMPLSVGETGENTRRRSFIEEFEAECLAGGYALAQMHAQTTAMKIARASMTDCPITCQVPGCSRLQVKPRKIRDGAAVCPSCLEAANARKAARDREIAKVRDRADALEVLNARLDIAERKAIREWLAPLREERKRILAQRPRRRYSGPPRRGYVYRLRDTEGRLLYVGKTWNVQARLFSGPSCHAQTKPWWTEVASCQVAVFRTEAAALKAEAWAIKKERPLYNVAQPIPTTKRPPRPLHSYEGAL